MNVRFVLAAATLAACLAHLVLATEPAAQTRAAAPAEAAVYVDKAAEADLFEIQASEIALDRVRHLDVRQFARTMIDHHRKSTKLLTEGARQTSSPSPVAPAALPPARERKLAELRAALGNIDQLYLDLQLEAHEEALALHRYYARNGDDPALRQAAAERAALVELHLADIRRMTSNLAAAGR